jgi:hypothetical protein
MSKQEKTREIMFSKIREWQVSGLSQTAFCKQSNVGYGNFHYWYKRFRCVDAPDQVGFAPLQVSDLGVGIFASVIFSNGHTIQLHQAVHPNYLKELLS